jgi:hypothetical protein
MGAIWTHLLVGRLRHPWLDPAMELAHPELIVAGREFTHIHPDGSMHLTLPDGLA